MICGGCTDPEQMADRSVSESPVIDRAAATQDILDDSQSGSRTESRDDEILESEKVPTALRASVEVSSPPGSDAPSIDLTSNSEKPPATKRLPEEEYKFEFVSGSGNEGLELGDTIPEITGRDLDNISFNLTDYQGKVIMLDFWGDW